MFICRWEVDVAVRTSHPIKITKLVDCQTTAAAAAPFLSFFFEWKLTQEARGRQAPRGAPGRRDEDAGHRRGPFHWPVTLWSSLAAASSPATAYPPAHPVLNKEDNVDKVCRFFSFLSVS